MINLAMFSQKPEEVQEFFDHAIHDLRLAARGISTSAELLSETCHPESAENRDLKDAFENLQRGVARMTLILDGMASYSVALQPESFSSAEFAAALAANAALKSLNGFVRDSGAKITLGALPNIKADGTRVTELFRILIDNAIRYRGAAPPQVEVLAKVENGVAVFSVRDNGMGIDQKYIVHIFRPFYRLHGSQIPGAGLGLAIAKGIVEGHRGKIWVESATGVGSVFCFELPAAE